MSEQGSSPRSLLLITVDCLRASHVGFLGYQRGTTPFLDSLAGESLLLPNAIVAGSPTYYSFPAIMASRHPLAFGRDIIGLAPGEPTLANTLQNAGYATAAFVAGNVYLSSRFGYQNGFDTFQDFLDRSEMAKAGEQNSAPGLRSRVNQQLARLSERAGVLQSIYGELYFRYCQWVASPGLSFDQARRAPPADVVVDQACDWLGGLAGKPFFLWLHLMDPHAPYYPREEALRLMGAPSMTAARAVYLNSFWRRDGLSLSRYQRHKDEIVCLYDASIRWVDEQIGRLVARMRGLQLWKNCVFAFTADHGEEFLERGGRFHSPANLKDELIRVPLLLHHPENQARGIRQNPFSVLDLAPTILESAGQTAPSAFRGRSRWRELQQVQVTDEPAITECVSHSASLMQRPSRMGPRVMAVREAQFKLVFDFRTGGELLFDLHADPAEVKPLPADSHKLVRRRLLQRIHSHLSDSVQSRDSFLRLEAILQDIRSTYGTRAGDVLDAGDTFSETAPAGIATR